MYRFDRYMAPFVSLPSPTFFWMRSNMNWQNWTLQRVEKQSLCDDNEHIKTEFCNNKGFMFWRRFVNVTEKTLRPLSTACNGLMLAYRQRIFIKLFSVWMQPHSHYSYYRLSDMWKSVTCNMDTDGHWGDNFSFSDYLMRRLQSCAFLISRQHRQTPRHHPRRTDRQTPREINSTEMLLKVRTGEITDMIHRKTPGGYLVLSNAWFSSEWTAISSSSQSQGRLATCRITQHYVGGKLWR